jgi:hypothetical protein
VTELLLPLIYTSHVARITDVYHHSWLVFEIGFHKLFAGREQGTWASIESQSFYVCFPSSCNYSCEPLYPASTFINFSLYGFF